MGASNAFTIGNEVICSDGVCGVLTRVVVDPIRRALTHIVVQPLGHGSGRLVPVDLVTSASGTVNLACTVAEVATLESAEGPRLLPGGASGHFGYGPEQMLSWPFYGLSVAGVDGGIDPVSVSVDRVPEGEVDVRRGDHVHATDGDIGRVQGLVIDPRDYCVTHFLLDEGHLWGKKRVAIPITAVNNVNDGVALDLCKAEVRDLPPVDIDVDGGDLDSQ
ncbi:MAG: PRC-barrel domain-containing protein [Acidimicrobiales bacterium]